MRMQIPVKQLIQIARVYMSQSSDPVHAIDHAERVVSNVRRFCREMSLSPDSLDALILAGWWHDVGRTITRKPSLIWMPFVDDILSAILLLWEMIRTGTIGTFSFLAVRLILCKSLGTGRFLTKVLLRKKQQVYLDILADADALDMLDPLRGDQLCRVVESSRLYRVGYRIMVSWFIFSSHFKMRTEMGKRFFLELLREFEKWFQDARVYAWHVYYYGELFAKRVVFHIQRTLGELSAINASPAV